MNLSYNNIEFIVIDGKSNDGTLKIIKKYSNCIDYWISKKDNGIYDAMNKGSKYSRGEALFLNAGDKLRDKEFVKLISHFQKYKKI